MAANVNILEEGVSKKDLQPEASVTPEVKATAEQFLSTFYQTFDSNRTALGQLFVKFIIIIFNENYI